MSCFSYPASEAFECLLAGEIVIVLIAQEVVGGLVIRGSQFLRQFLHGTEAIWNEDRIFANTLPDECRACHRATWAFNNDLVTVFDPSSLGDRGMDLNQTNPIHLFAGEGPLSDTGKM